MEFFRRATVPTTRLGVLPGTFNPVTVAHLALAESALAHVDEVLFVLPRRLPHKVYAGASFEERVEMLAASTAAETRWSIAGADGGLFLEIADECRSVYGVDTQLSFICGRDAAERIVSWDYGRPGAVEEMLRRFHLLVARRQGAYAGGGRLGGAVKELAVERDYDAVSASEVRERIRRGEPWEHLVPAGVREMARRIYGATGS